MRYSSTFYIISFHSKKHYHLSLRPHMRIRQPQFGTRPIGWEPVITTEVLPHYIQITQPVADHSPTCMVLMKAVRLAAVACVFLTDRK